MNKYQERYENIFILIEIVSGLAVIILLSWYYFTPAKNVENSKIKPISAEMLVASSSILSESNAVNNVIAINDATGSTPAKDAGLAKDTIVTAYIKEINGDKITLDYFDLLGGKNAEKAAVADGKCTQQQIDSNSNDECFPNGTVYFRNQNPKLRTFVISPDARAFRTTAFDKSSDGTEEILRKEIKMEYVNMVYQDGQGILNLPYKVTLNGKNEVVKLEEIFRP